MLVIMQNTQEKADLQKMPKRHENNKTKVCADGNKLRTEKEWKP